MEYAAFIATALLYGLGINYLADVLPFTRKFTQPACHTCGSPTQWFDYLLGRACRTCGQRRSVRYPLVLILVLLISLLLWNTIPESRDRWISQLLLGYFGLVAVIDMEHRLILHPVSITGAFIAFILGFYFHGLVPTMLGGFAGFAIMLFLYYLGSFFAKWAARRRGEDLDEVALGFGDVNLAGICGLLLGWPGITAALMIAILLGGLVSLGIIAAQVIRRSYKPFMAIPYGPFLILGTCLLLYRALIS